MPEVFKRAKKDGNKRMILSLKKCNKVINYKHFQMESIKNVTNPKPNVSLGLIYLRDAFFSVSVHPKHQKYLKFFFEIVYQFTYMPNEYGSPKNFTKTSKVPFQHLCHLGHS